MFAMVTTSIPRVADPQDTDEHCFFSVLFCFKFICLFLKCVELFDNCFFGQIGADTDIIKTEGITEKFFSILAIFNCVLPN